MNHTTPSAWPQLRCKGVHSSFCATLIHLYWWFVFKRNTAINSHCIKVLASPKGTAKRLPYKIMSPDITKEC